MGGGSLRDFFGSEILAKRDVLGSTKDVGIFLGRKKLQVCFGYCQYFSAAQINNNVYCWCGDFF